MDILKNPIIIGLICGIITYGYLYYTAKNDKKKNKLKKINLLIPLAVTCIGWFIAHAYFGNKKQSILPPLQTTVGGSINPGLPLPYTVGSNNLPFVNDVISSNTSDPKSFSLLTNGITVPTKLPDVLLDMH